MCQAWIRAIFSCLFCLAIGIAVFSCQWMDLDKPKPAEPKAEDKPAPPVRPAPISLHGTLKTIRDRGELLVGMQPGYAPFQMKATDGGVKGFDVDCAVMVAHDLKVGLKIVPLGWQELVPALLEGKVDVLMSGITVTPDRNLEVVFTEPILRTGRMFLVNRKDSDRFGRLSDLNSAGVFVAVKKGGEGAMDLKTLLPLAAIREFPDAKTALQEVLQGRANAYLDDEFTVREACAKHPDRLIGRFRPLTFEPVAWAIKPGDGHWLNWLNNVIRQAKEDGRVDAAEKKWFRDYFLDMSAPMK